MFLHDDVRTLDAARLLAGCGRLPSVIVGSPPCQDISAANARGRGVDGERSGLFFEAIRLIADCRPVWACLENSPRLRIRGADRVLGELEALGYACWPVVVGARHAGAPHRRDRVWLVAADARRAGNPALDRGAHGDAPTDREKWAIGPAARRGNDRAVADADRARLVLGQGERGDPCQEQPAAGRAGASARHPWAAGVPPLALVDDGAEPGVAQYRAVCAAQGDAIVPQIATAIGRAMMRLLPTDGAVLDLFSGAVGGWSLGLHAAGYRTIAACEIDPWRREVFARTHAGLAADGAG